MLVASHVLEHFEIWDAHEYHERWVIEMREKEDVIPPELSDFYDVVFDGYTNPMETISHSFVCKSVWLKLYRRRYKRSKTDSHYSNEYDVSLKGVRMVPDLGLFLRKKIEEHPVNIAVVARMFCLKVKPLYHIYKEHLSDYRSDIESKIWCNEQIGVVNKSTGEISVQPLYVFKPENIGENMSIDDKAIGHDGFTILSNSETGKIALLVESTSAEGVESAMKKFGSDLHKIKHVSMDMSPTYTLVFNDLVPHAVQVADKFHVMKYAYEAVGEVRKRVVRELQSNLSAGKSRSEEDKKLLTQIEHLRRISHAITQSQDKWNSEMKETVNQVFNCHEELKKAYQISQNFKQWYDIGNRNKTTARITEDLHQWYLQATPIAELKSVIKMMRKHEQQIINYFHHGATNAKAECLNGKIQRFITNNYGLKNKDFFLFRLARYFS
jgi:hypothetical protein